MTKAKPKLFCFIQIKPTVYRHKTPDILVVLGLD